VALFRILLIDFCQVLSEQLAGNIPSTSCFSSVVFSCRVNCLDPGKWNAFTPSTIIRHHDHHHHYY